MAKKMRLGIFLVAALFQLSLCTRAQQTLGGITGTVSDISGSVLPDTSVTIVGDQTKLTRTQKTNGNGAYDFVNLPIGTYTVTVTHDGFQTEKLPSIPVQADRTATLNVSLKVGQVGTTIEVEAAPAMNAVDTTNGYVLEQEQIQEVPLPTGSFTGLAILSPGVNAELPNGTGVNAGLGNQPIWANGQRDTSNTFLLNGVDASNLFNGKSTSQVASARVVNNTGVAGAGSTTAEIIQSTASPYLAIGQALPTPAPETIQEFHVNTSMYDAQQGSTSGAHIDMSTISGTNSLHGSAYVHRGTDWLNAAPYFYNQDQNIPSNEKVPQLHRYTAGGTLGFPLIKDKLFGFVSYQHIHASDLEMGTSRTAVPSDLTDDRSAAALAAVDFNNWGTTVNPVVAPNPPGGGGTPNIDPVAYALSELQATQRPVPVPVGESEFRSDAELSRECLPHAAGLFHFGPGRRQSRLSAHDERHSLLEVLLSARSQHGAVSDSLRSKVLLNAWMLAARWHRSRTRNRSGRTSACPKYLALFAKKFTAPSGSLSLRNRWALTHSALRFSLGLRLSMIWATNLL